VVRTAFGLIHTPRAHICPVLQHCPCVADWGSLTVMTCTPQAARAAAQLHEAAQDVARVAARRSAQAEGRLAQSPIQQGHELTEDLRTEAPDELGVCTSGKKSKPTETPTPSRRSAPGVLAAAGEDGDDPW
jgi:hypothetical protein